MQSLAGLEDSVMSLLKQHQSLKRSCAQLLAEKKQWTEERQLLLREVDRILEQLDDLSGGES